jgi:prepilin-type N-terminal cleavage/methylation domain-containing protein
MIKSQRRYRHGTQPAFTLMEIILVTAIIAVLASLTFGGMSYYGEKMKYSRTQVLIASIERALEDYKSDNGAYPSGANTAAVFTALYGDGSNVYLSTLNPDFLGKQKNVEAGRIIDAWENELGYTYPGSMNPTSDFDLWSEGGDAVANTADDIKNW